MHFCCHSSCSDFIFSSLHFQPSFSQENISKEMGKKINPSLMVPCFQLKDVDLEGWMNKLGGSGLTPKNWRKRWFVLKGGRLYYYKTAFVRVLIFYTPMRCWVRFFLLFFSFDVAGCVCLGYCGLGRLSS